ncbi:MAG: diguanylate cyclase [Spirochaetota bacterium]
MKANIPHDVHFSIYNAISEAVIITDARHGEDDVRILYVNQAFERLTGYTLAEITGKSHRILYGPKTDVDVINRLRRAMEAGEIFFNQTVLYHSDGTPLHVEWRHEPVLDDTGAIQNCVIVQQDVTGERVHRRRSAELELVREINSEISAEGLDLGVVRRRVAEIAMRITQSEAAVVEERVGDDMVYRAVTGTAANSLGLHIPLSLSISGIAYRNKRTVICDDAETDDRIKLKEKARKIGFRSAVISPLMYQGECYGVLKAYSSVPHYFNENHRKLIELASDFLASSLFDAEVLDEEVKRRHVLLDAIPIYIAFLDTQMRYTEVNAAYEDLFGQTVAEIRGKHISDVIGPENFIRLRYYLEGAFSGERVSFEVDLVGPSGRERTYSGNIEPHRTLTGAVDGCYIAIQDVTSRRLAETDYLTGLMNRRKFEDMVRFLMGRRDRDDSPLALILLDIDDFKQINDKHGHLKGDAVLKQLGTLINHSVRSADLACRWGGEEFAVLLYDASSRDAVNYARRLIDRIRSHPFDAIGTVTVSAGTATVRESDDMRDAFHRADEALYRAKEEGKDRIVPAQE